MKRAHKHQTRKKHRRSHHTRETGPRRKGNSWAYGVGFTVVLALAGSLFLGSCDDRTDGPTDATAGPGSEVLGLPTVNTTIAVSPDSADPEERGVALLQDGNQLLERGQTEEALERYREAAKHLPEDEDVLYNLGIALARLNRTDEAIAAYEAALNIYPDYAEVHNNLGNLLLRTGRHTEAIEHFRAAITSIPEHASAHNNLGNALCQQGDIEAAGRHFQEAVECDPAYWEARFNLANVWETQGQLEQAASQFREVLRLNPDFAPARQALAQIEKRISAPNQDR